MTADDLVLGVLALRSVVLVLALLLLVSHGLTVAAMARRRRAPRAAAS